MEQLSICFNYPSELPYRGPATLCCKQQSLGCSPFARHYLGNRCRFLFLRVLRCFSSPGIALKPYFIQTPVTPHYQGRVSPLGHPRIRASLPLPEAFRSLARPSSPSGTKAFTMRPLQLGKNIHIRRHFPDAESRFFVYAIVKEPLRPLPEKILAITGLWWWAWLVSNQRPHPYQGCALTN